MWNTPVNSNRSNWLGAQRFRANTLQSTLNLLLRRPNFQDFSLPPQGRGSTFCRTSFRGRCTPHTWRRLPSGTSSPCTSQIRLRSKANSMTCKEDSNEQPRLTASGHNRAGHHVGLGVLHGGQHIFTRESKRRKRGATKKSSKHRGPCTGEGHFPIQWHEPRAQVGRELHLQHLSRQRWRCPQAWGMSQASNSAMSCLSR